MTYQIIETSRDDGSPVELYQISYTENEFFYTSGDTEITYNSRQYKPAPISRSDINPGSDINQATLNITVVSNSPIGEIFRVSPPSESVILTIFATHANDGEFTVIWKGRITGAEWKTDGELQLTSDSIFSSLRNVGLRRRCQAQCAFALYGADCGVDRDAFREDTTLTAVSGISLSIASAIGKPDNWYAGGYVTWLNNTKGNTEKRMIRSSVGSTGVLVLASIPTGLSATQAIKLYPGCSHTLEGVNGCAVKFNNHKRYGGMPYMPIKNPYGSSIY